MHLSSQTEARAVPALASVYGVIAAISEYQLDCDDHLAVVYE